MFTYDLLDAPWLPCRGLDGQLQLLGLRPALLRAHELAALADPSPSVTLALHRLLLAVLHRALNGPRNHVEWAAIYQAGHLPVDVVERYLGNWQHRFDLFHPTNPFYQTSQYEVDRYPCQARRLLPERVSDGNARTLFDHELDEWLTPAEAARGVVACHAFDVGGMVSRESQANMSAKAGLLARAAVVLVKGVSLFQTLLFNLVRFHPDSDWPLQVPAGRAPDLPAWERVDPVQPEERVPTGYLDWLTWQSRRLRLLPEERPDGTVGVRTLLRMKGANLRDGLYRRQFEPMMAFRQALKAGPRDEPYPAVELREDRALWRDSTSLLLSTGADGQGSLSIRPKTLEWLADLTDEGHLSQQRIYPLDAHGLVTDQANVRFWRHERMVIPAAYLNSRPLQDRLALAMKYAEGVGQAVDVALRQVALLLLQPRSDEAGASLPKADAVNGLRTSLGGSRNYWARLEVPFSRFLEEQAEERLPDGTDALAEWTQELKDAARAAFDEAVSGADSSGRTLRAVAGGELRLRLSMAKALQGAQLREEVTA